MNGDVDALDPCNVLPMDHAVRSAVAPPKAVPMNGDRSEAINELATALAKAQGEMAAAAKDNLNPHFGSRYADLASIWEACRGPLTKHGLSIVQVAGADGAKVVVNTVLMHASGQWISGQLTMTAQQATPQSIGSALTYARRYSLSAMAGVAPSDDDDGQAASTPVREKREKLNKVDPETGEIEEPKVKVINAAQRARLFTIATKNGWSKALVKEGLKEAFGLDSTGAITTQQYDAVVNMFSAPPPPPDADMPF